MIEGTASVLDKQQLREKSMQVSKRGGKGERSERGER